MEEILSLSAIFWICLCINVIVSWVLMLVLTTLIRKYKLIKENEIDCEDVFLEGLVTIALIMLWGVSVTPVIKYAILLWNAIF